MTIELRPYQADAVKAIMSFFHDSKGKNGIIAMPTGTGKSIVMSEIIRLVRKRWGVKVLLISHVKEILDQNVTHIERHMNIKVGVYSSMIGRREIEDVTVAGIQSIYRKPELFQDYKLIIVDECHRISTKDDSMYRRFLDNIPGHSCVGLTATPFRLGDGYIYGPGQVFDSIVYDCTSKDHFVKLIDDGYLCPLTTKRTAMEMDVKGIRLVAGDFNDKQLSDKFDRDGVTSTAIAEIIKSGHDRKKWLIFAIDIQHSENIAEELIRNGIPTAPVHSRMSELGLKRTDVIKGFRDGKYKCLVNVNTLTTGFDVPGIDLIAMLRPTNSPVLHVQCLGRGSRVESGKSNCLVLDFAGNTARLGPINDIVVRVKGKGKTGGDPLTKECPKCQSIVHPAVRDCPDCNHKFQFEHRLEPTAYEEVIVEEGRHLWVEVSDVKYAVARRKNSPDIAKVTYTCQGNLIDEWICVEHKGFAKHRADHWVKYRGGSPCNTAYDVIAQADILKRPKKVLVTKKGQYKVIKESAF